MKCCSRILLGCRTAVLSVGLLIVLACIGISAFRPDLFRFERVEVLGNSGLRDAVRDRVAVLMSEEDTALLTLPGQHVELGEVGGRPAVFITTRAKRQDGGWTIVTGAAISQSRGWIHYRVGVVANGFDIEADGTRTPLPDEVQASLAMDLDTNELYRR